MAVDVQRTGAHDGADLARNLGWTALAAAVSLSFVLGVFGVLYNGFADGSWWGLLALPVDGLLSYWIAGGAWKRTTWGVAGRSGADGGRAPSGTR